MAKTLDETKTLEEVPHTQGPHTLVIAPHYLYLPQRACHTSAVCTCDLQLLRLRFLSRQLLLQLAQQSLAVLNLIVYAACEKKGSTFTIKA
jgi:hypothetical protein